MIDEESYSKLLTGTDTFSQIQETLHKDSQVAKDPVDKTEEELLDTVREARDQKDKLQPVYRLTEGKLPAGFRFLPDLLEYIARLTIQRDVARIQVSVLKKRGSPDVSSQD